MKQGYDFSNSFRSFAIHHLTKQPMKHKKYIKANRKGSRDAELQDGNGWITKHSVHKSMKSYSRKVKHKTLTY